MNAMEKLAGEIERVAKIRAIYESFSVRGLPNVNVAPAIAMMTASLERAKEANGSNDPVLVVQALQDLAGYEAWRWPCTR